MSRSDLGDEVRRVRKDRKLTQTDLAKLAAVATTNIGKIEKGERVSPTTMRAVARALALPAELVAPYVEDPKTPAMPNHADYPSEYEFMLAVYKYLVRERGMSHDAVIAGFNMAAAAAAVVERNRSDSDGKEVG